MPISPELQRVINRRLTEDERKLVSPENLEHTRQLIEQELKEEFGTICSAKDAEYKLVADRMVEEITKAMGVAPELLLPRTLRSMQSHRELAARVEEQQDHEAQRLLLGIDLGLGPDRTVMSTNAMGTWHGIPPRIGDVAVQPLVNGWGGTPAFDMTYRPDPNPNWIRREIIGDFDPGPVGPSTVGPTHQPIFVPDPGRTLREGEIDELRRQFARALEEMKNQAIVFIPDKKATEVEEPEEDGVAAPDFSARRRIEID